MRAGVSASAVGVLFALGCGASVEEEANRPVALSPRPRSARGAPPPTRGPLFPPGSRLNLRYGSEFAQRLDYLPAASGRKAPLIVLVHGGAWISGSRRMLAAAGLEMRRRGFAVALVDYRLSVSPEVRHPVHAGDVARAVGFLSARARALGFDSRRVVLVGHSAGAHIAATIATTPELARLARYPAGYVGLEGIYDLPSLAARWPTYPAWFLERAFGTDRGAWAAASPTRRPLATRAPWLVVHMLGDELVDVGQSDGFSKTLRRAGVRVRDLRPAGGSHDGAVAALGVKGDEVAEAVARFALSVPPRSGR